MTEPVDPPATVSYTGQAFAISQTPVFADWLAALRDARAKAKIADRARRAADGNFGDHKSVGGGVFEMRIDHGPGYRVYFFRRGQELIILLCGGDKKSQQRDIAEALRLKEMIEDGGTEAL
ncbi:MAG: hypothetical protein A4S12_08795 [Proteobacteria bacterium SG_bin5]|nr:type II toxin-antitoxin system RelE/ParE family toxin [Sphingomonas sp.]OQW41189.1 MAG: hypothetical protein A4S12_08795 [Proteobacteria bacterium SG_bin5]